MTDASDVSDDAYELFILMETAESDFGLGRAEDWAWQRENDPESRTGRYFVAAEAAGYVEIFDHIDDDGSGRKVTSARITQAGRKRLNELAGRGVQPADFRL